MQTVGFPPGGNIRVYSLQDNWKHLKEPDLSGLIDYIEGRRAKKTAALIIKYKTPHAFSIISMENGKDFLCVAVYLDKTHPDADLSPAYGLLPFKSLLGPARMPQLASMIYKGAFYTEQGCFHEKTTEETILSVLDDDDVCVVTGQPGTRLRDFAEKLVSKLKGESPAKGFVKPGMSPEAYASAVRVRNRDDFEKTNKIEEAVNHFNNFVFGKENAVKALTDIWSRIIAFADREDSESLRRYIEAAGMGANPVDNAKRSRLRKKIYSLPRNETIYQDHGEDIIKEGIRALREADIPEIKWAAAPLERLLEAYDGSAEWHGEVSGLRGRLLKDLAPVFDLYVDKELKSKITALLSDIILKERERTKGRNREKNKPLNEYVLQILKRFNEIKQYFNETDFTKPIMIRDIMIADMTRCEDPREVVEAALKAERIIMIGDGTEELFRVFLKGALYRQDEDKKQRVFVFRTAANRHPRLASWISRQFYEIYGLPGILPAGLEDTQIRPLVWIEKDANDNGLISHLFECVYKDIYGTIGIITFDESRGRELPETLEEEGLGTINKKITVLTDTSPAGDEFDLLYVVDGDGIKDMDRMRGAMVKAVKTLVVVGNKASLYDNPLLQDFYYSSLKER